LTQFFERVNSLAPRRLQEAHPEVRRFIKFAIVGFVGAVVDFTVLTLLVFGLHIPDYIANIFSVSAAIVSNFTWNRLWTFPESRAHVLHKHFLQFALVNLAGLAINEIVFVLLDQKVFELFLGQYGIYPAKLFAIGIVLFWNFGVNRIWTYRHIKLGE
jgi:putative flippase GtrA